MAEEGAWGDLVRWLAERRLEQWAPGLKVTLCVEYIWVVWMKGEQAIRLVSWFVCGRQRMVGRAEHNHVGIEFF